MDIKKGSEMTKDELLQEALYLIEAFENGADAEDYYMDICRFKEALVEQPTQEPFGIWHVGDTEEESDFFLYKDSGDVSCENCIKLYTHPKQWQGLSKDEVDIIDAATWDEDHKSWSTYAFVRAIEAKLREKNT